MKRLRRMHRQEVRAEREKEKQKKHDIDQKTHIK